MNVPKPSGYEVYWEKWIDAFEAEEVELAENLAELEQVLTNEELAEHAKTMSISHIRSIMTPFGVLPLTEQSMASQYFKFWVGHSNFKLTTDFYDIIGQHPGIETLDILTPYRFRIAVGQLFVDREVMTGVRDVMIQYITTNHRKPTPHDNNQKDQ